MGTNWRWRDGSFVLRGFERDYFTIHSWALFCMRPHAGRLVDWERRVLPPERTPEKSCKLTCSQAEGSSQPATDTVATKRPGILPFFQRGVTKPMPTLGLCTGSFREHLLMWGNLRVILWSLQTMQCCLYWKQHLKAELAERKGEGRRVFWNSLYFLLIFAINLKLL